MRRFSFEATVDCPVRGTRWHARVDFMGEASVYVPSHSALPLVVTFWDYEHGELAEMPGLPSTARKALGQALSKAHDDKARNQDEYLQARAKLVKAAKNRPDLQAAIDDMDAAFERGEAA